MTDIEEAYDDAFPRRIKEEPGDPSWLRTPSAAASVAASGRADARMDGDPTRPSRPQLGPKYLRAWHRARHEQGETDVLLDGRRLASYM